MASINLRKPGSEQSDDANILSPKFHGPNPDYEDRIHMRV